MPFFMREILQYSATFNVQVTMYMLYVNIYPCTRPLTSAHAVHIYPSPPFHCTSCTYLPFPTFPLYMLYIFILPLHSSVHLVHIYPSLLSAVHAVHIYPSPPFLCTCCTYLSIPCSPLYMVYIFILPFFFIVHAVQIYPPTPFLCTLTVYMHAYYILFR